MEFTAQINNLIDNEIIVFKDREVFCHLSVSDFVVFRDNFKQSIKFVPLNRLGFTESELRIIYGIADLSDASLLDAKIYL